MLKHSHHAYVQLAGNIRESYQEKITLTVMSILALAVRTVATVGCGSMPDYMLYHVETSS